MPDVLTVAIAVLLLLQVPPAVESARAVVAPVHKVAVPVMAPAEEALTCTTVSL